MKIGYVRGDYIMRGRYYARHTVYHTIDNQTKNKNLNDNYKNVTIKNAINYLKSDNKLSIEEKVIYLRNLTQNNWRYGTKYKYDCNLKSTDIAYIVKSVGDAQLFKSYFGQTMEEYDASMSRITLISTIVIAVVFILLLVKCSV